MTVATVTEFRTHFGEKIDQVATTREPIVIEIDGREIAALTPLDAGLDLSKDDFADMLWAIQAEILIALEEQNGGPITIGDIDEMIDAGHP